MKDPIENIRDNAKRIEALCETPHWTSDRKQRIADLARGIQMLLADVRQK